jgi:hypothetical protein
MSTFTYILVVAGCALIALWLVLAVCFGVGVLGQRGSINAGRETAARMLSQTSKPISRTQWVWVSITAVPLLLFGAAVVVVHFFSSLLVVGWCRLTGRPIPQPRRLEDFDDDDVA